MTNQLNHILFTRSSDAWPAAIKTAAAMQCACACLTPPLHRSVIAIPNNQMRAGGHPR